MNCSLFVHITWRQCVVRGNITEMVNRDRCICLLQMGASKANANVLVGSRFWASVEREEIIVSRCQ